MGIVTENEITCSITIKEGTGTISSASFSVGTRKDPTNTDSFVQIQTRADIPKPFILGVSKANDSGTCYKYGDYKGISSVGSGEGATITLTFSEAVDNFTLYFDDTMPSIPTSFTINSTAITNDRTIYFYSQDTAQTTFTMNVTTMNRVNNVAMPIIIVGVENRVGIFADKRSGLQDVRLSHKYSSKAGN